jgi:YNFM family putative membrane transporter
MFDVVPPRPLVVRSSLPLGLLAAAGFLSSAGARIVDSLLAVIAGDFGTSVPSVAIIVAAFSLPYGLCQIALGPIGDRVGKLRLILAALVCYAVFTGACSLASSLTALTVLRACAGAASAGLIPVCIAYIGDAVPYASRQVTLSRFLVGVMVAQTVAGPLGGVFGEHVGWRGAFLLLAAGALVVGAQLARQLPHLPDKQNDLSFSLDDYRLLATRVVSRRLLVATAIEGALVGAVIPFVAPFLHENYGLSFAAAGLVLACFGLGALAYERLARRMVSRLGEAGMVLLGCGIMAVALAFGVGLDGWLAFIPVEFSIGFGYFTLHTVLQARATELLPDARATAVASFVFMLFVGQSLGALAASFAIASIGYRFAFSIDAVFISVFGLCMYRFVRASA